MVYDRSEEREAVPIAETLAAVKELLAQGKIRHYGLSNETTFGVCEWCRAADAMGVQRPVSVQNQFSLLFRTFETELAEACAPRNLDIALLPWTPLGGGILTTAYLTADGGALMPRDEWPADARHRMYPKWMARMTVPKSLVAVGKYAAIAKANGVDLTYLSLAFCRSRPFAAAAIVGAQNVEQLEEDVAPFLEDAPLLSQACLDAIDEVHLECMNPLVHEL